MSEPKREPKVGDLWDMGGSIILLYDAGSDIGLGNTIVGKDYCILGATQGKGLIAWLKNDGRFLCSLSDVCDKVKNL